MSGPSIVCKSGYLHSIQHFFNIIEYSGNKVAAQTVIYLDGSNRDVDPDKRILLDPLEESMVAGIAVSFKDGTCHVISYPDYAAKTVQRRDAIRVDEVVAVETDPGTPHDAADLDFFKYLPYVAERPGVEKEDGYGLFGVTPERTGNIPTQEAKDMGELYESSRKWSHIISLPTEEGEAAGYNTRLAWKELIISKAPELAKAYNISLENLILNCAYHGNTDNPHVHLIMYSTDPTEGFVRGGKEGMQKASERIKSLLAGEIYRDRRIELTKAKELHRQGLSRDLSNRLDKMEIPPKLAHEFEQLGNLLADLPGKREYGYLPPEVKQKVDQMLGQLFSLPELAPSFAAVCDAQRQLISQYIIQEDRLKLRMDEFRADFFHPAKGRANYHNLVIRATLDSARKAKPAAPPKSRELLKEKTDDTTAGGELSSSLAGKEFSFSATPEPDWSIPYPEPPPDLGDEWIAPEVDSWSKTPGAPTDARITERKNAQITTHQHPVSRPLGQKEDKEVIPFGPLARCHRELISGIFDSGVELEPVRKKLLERLTGLRTLQITADMSWSEKKARWREIDKRTAQIVQELYQAWPEYRDGLDALISNANTSLSGNERREKIMEPYFAFQQSGASPPLNLTAYLRWFASAEKQKEEAAVQILHDHGREPKSFGDTRRAANTMIINRLLDRESPDTVLRQHLDNINTLMEYPHSQKELAAELQPVFELLGTDPLYADRLEAYLADADDILQEHYRIPGDILACQSIQRELYRSIRRLLPIHNSVIGIANRYPELLARAQIKPNLAKVREELHAALRGEDGFLTEYTRQSLISAHRSIQAELTSDGTISQESAKRLTESCNGICRMLYTTSNTFRGAVDIYHERLYQVMKAEGGAAYAQKRMREIQDELFQNGNPSVFSRCVSTIVEELPFHFIRSNQPIIETELRAFRASAFRAFHEALSPLDPNHRAFSEFREKARDGRASGEDVEALLRALSSRFRDFKRMEEKMFQSLNVEAEKHQIPFSSADFHSFLTGENPYHSSQVREMFTNLGVNGFGPWDATAFLRSLCRLLALQAQQHPRGQVGQRRESHSFQAKNKFKRKTPFGKEDQTIEQ